MEKQFDHLSHQQRLAHQWESAKTYSAPNNPGPQFSIDTPPPTVSGSLHIGHLFSYTQTDIIARYKRMTGLSVFYPFGFDDNGLPTEKYVEKKLNISAHAMGRTEFIKVCLKETHGVEEEFKQLWQTMGLSVDWNLCYSTISDSTRKISQQSFIELYKKRYIYRKNEPALYCTTCRTSVAQAELDDMEVPSHFNDIVFTASNGDELSIGTTRPELLPACVALLYNPNDLRYQYLKGMTAKVPLFGFEVPVIADELVEIEKGTGLVMCCTFGDKTDITWFKKHNLPYKQVIGFDGKMLPSADILAGLKVGPAREAIIDALKEKNLLLRQKPITHSVNIHERCKKEIEYVMLPQWFLNLLDHKQKFIDMGNNINWHPAHMKSRYINWVKNLGWDWCLSRQRFYGIPFPVWHCNSCNHIILASEQQLPIDPQETTFAGTCPQCKNSDITPDTDVMDTWNTSSVTPYICYQLANPNTQSPFTDKQVEQFIPMSMRPQAHDIIRTWAFYTIIKSAFHNNRIPWNDIVISGHVLSDAKEKLSKSKGNAALEPQQLLKNHPADAIRYWTASGSLGQDVAFSDAQIKIGQRLVTKLWNAFRFVLDHAQNIDPKKSPEQFGTINEWLLDNASKTFASYTHYLEHYEFGLALAQVERFFWHNFCDNYLELVKDQLFKPERYSAQEVEATRWTLYQAGLRILQMYAPYIPYVTETLYQQLYQPRENVASLHQTKYNVVQTAFDFPTSSRIAEVVIEIASTVRKLKTERQLSLKTELATLNLHTNNNALIDAIKKLETIIKGVTQAHQMTLNTDVIAQSSIEQVEPIWNAHIALSETKI